jgi:hypothetical protein
MSNVPCERLEPRALLAAIFWTGLAGDGLWDTPENWAGLAVPTSSDDVTINLSGTYSVTVSAPTAAAAGTLQLGGASGTQTLVIDGALALDSGGTVTANGAVILRAGGHLGGGGNLQFNAGRFDWTGGTLAGAAGTTATFFNGAVITLGGASTKRLVSRSLTAGFPSTLNWSGGGDVEIENAFITSSGTVEVTAAATMRLAGGATGGFGTTGPFRQPSGNATFDLDVNIVGIGPILIDGALTFSGGGTLRRTITLGGSIIVREESFLVGGAGHFEGPGTLRYASGSHLSISTLIGPLARLEVVGAATQLEVWSFSIGVLSIRDGALVEAPAGPSRAGALDIDASSRLDLRASAFVVDYTGPSPIAQVAALLASGYAGGAWTGSGVGTSSGPAIGYAESTDLFTTFPAMFGGTTVDESSVLLRLTRPGDANLDAQVNLTDFNLLATHFGQSGATWHQGNFNYDARVNLIDFNLLAGNFGQTMGPRASGGLGSHLRDLLD